MLLIVIQMFQPFPGHFRRRDQHPLPRGRHVVHDLSPVDLLQAGVDHPGAHERRVPIHQDELIEAVRGRAVVDPLGDLPLLHAVVER